MRKPLAAAVVAAIAMVAACSEAKSEDAGPTIARNYNVGSFDSIEVAGPYDVEVTTGGQAAVSGRGAERLMERTIVEVRGNKLVIRMKEQTSWVNFGGRSGKARFTVSVPALRAAAIGGSGGINVDKVKGEEFAGEIAGSGSLRLGSTDVRSVTFEIAGSGDIRPGSGRVEQARYEIGGSGGIDAAGLQAGDVKVSIAGSGNVRGHATRTAAIEIMGSGDVVMTGGAKCSVSKMGSGTARCS